MRRVKPERRRILAGGNDPDEELQIVGIQSAARLCGLQAVGRWFTARDRLIRLGPVTLVERPEAHRRRMDLATQRRLRLLRTIHGQIRAVGECR